MNALEVKNVCHWFGDNLVLYNVNLEIAAGQIVSMVGPSGCGKSTLLRAILGTHPPRKGEILAEGRLVNLACAEGHPSQVMSLSFCGQALAVKYCMDNRGDLPNEVITLPEEIDRRIAILQLEAMDVKIDDLSEEQRNYLESWSEGT